MHGAAICPKCSGEVRAGVKFCTHCGQIMPQSDAGADRAAAQPAQAGAPALVAAKPEKKKHKPAEMKIKQDFWRPDSYVPDGARAPLPARAAAFIIDLSLFILFADLVAWIGVVWPAVDEIKSFISMGGQFELTSALSRIILFTVFCFLYLLFYGIIPVSVSGQTLGKFLAGIKVETQDGKPPDIPRTFSRYVLYNLSGLPLFIGFLWAISDPVRDTWHDKLTKTHVAQHRNCGTVKLFFLYASPLFFALILSGSFIYAKSYVRSLEFKGPYDTATINGAAKVYCDSIKNPMAMYSIMPPEFRTGRTGLLVFLSVYNDVSSGKNFGIDAPAGSICKTKSSRKIDNSRVWLTFTIESGGDDIWEPSEFFVRIKDKWYMRSDKYELLRQ